MVVDIYSYGNVDALNGIFNGIAMIFKASEYHDMIRVVIAIGFMVIGILAALPSGHHKGWTWIMTVGIVYAALFVPRTSVLITDKLGTQAPVAVGNVPWALGVFASVKSSIGQTLTNLAETAFQTIPNGVALPAELSYQDHGMMFGNRMIKASRSANIIDPQFRSDMINYNRNCVVPEIGHSIDPKTFQQSGNLWGSMATTNMALFTNYMKGGVYVVNSCGVAYQDLNTELPAAVAEVQQQIAASQFPNLSPADANGKITGSMQAAYERATIAGAGSAVSDILLQNMMINLFADTQQVISVATADPAAVMLAATRANATAQMNMSYSTQGRMAEEALPIIRNATEAILFAMFPIVVLLLLTSEGQGLAKILKMYLYALVWIELWPFLFAVLNFIATTYSARNIAGAAYTAAGTALSLDNAGQIYSTTISDVSVVGYMVTMIPALAGALLFGMDRMVSAIPGGRDLGGAADREAAQLAKGNAGMGNMQFDNQGLSPMQSDPFMYSKAGVIGTSARNMLSGAGTDTYNMGSNPLAVRDTQQISQSASIERGTALERSDTLGKSASTEMAAAFNTTLGLLKTAGLEKSKGLGVDVSTMDSQGNTDSDKRDVASGVAMKLGISDIDSVAKAMDVNLSPPTIVKTLIGLNASIGGRAASTQQINSAIETGRTELASKGFLRQQQLVDNFQSKDEFREARSSNRQATDQISASSSNAHRFQESSAAALRDAQRYGEVVRRAELVSRDTTYDYTRDWNDWLRDKGLSLTTDRKVLSREAESFLLSGGVESIDGEDRFMPQRGGGPNIMAHVVSDVGDVSPEGLRRGYAGANPGGGLATVEGADAGYRLRMGREQHRYGLDPKAAVSDGGLREQVAETQLEGRLGADRAGHAAGEALRDGKADYNKRVQEAWDDPSLLDRPALNKQVGAVPKAGGSDYPEKFPGAEPPTPAK